MERDALGVVGFLRADLLLADPVLDRGQEVVANRHVERGERRHLDARGRFDAEHGGMAVGADEPARAELDAAEVARDDDDDVGQLVLLDGLEDGIARRAAGLAVIVRLLLVGALAEHVGGAVVARVEVLLLHGLDEAAGFFLSLDMADVCDESRFLYLIERLDGVVRLADGSIAVHDCLLNLFLSYNYTLFSARMSSSENFICVAMVIAPVL